MISKLKKLFSAGRELSSGPIARGSMASLSIRVIGLLLSFAQGVIAARLLGAEGYGLAAVALSIVQIGATLALFGYGNLAMREFSAWLSKGQIYLLKPFTKQAIIWILILSAITSCLVVATGTFWPEYREVLLIGAVIIPAFALIQFFRGALQGFGDVVSAQWPSELLRPAILIALILGSVAIAPFNATNFLVLFAIAAFAATLAGAILLSRKFAKHRPVATHGTVPRNWHRQAAPFLGLSLLAIAQGEMATLMLAIFTTPEQAGLYQPIARLTPIIALPVTAAAMRYAPRVSEFWNSDQMPRLIGVTRTFTLATTILTAGVAIALAIGGPWILQLYGEEFVSVAPLLWIVGGAQIFHAACGPVGLLLTMTGHNRAATINMVISVLTTFVAAMILVPQYGTLGAAVAISIALVVWNLISVLTVRRLLHFNPSLWQMFSKLVTAKGPR